MEAERKFSEEEKKFLKKLENFIEKYRNVENVEIEARFGTISNQKFVPALTKEQFLEIIKNLNSYKAWSKIIHPKLRQTRYYSDGIRSLSWHDSPCVYQIVEHLENIDFEPKDRQICVRFSAKREIPLEKIPNEEPKFIREVYRGFYYYKDTFEYCISKCTEGKNVEDCSKKENTFELEIEIKNLNQKNLALSFFGKAMDIVGRYNSLGENQPFF
jgi:hypothetical protein